MAPALSGAPSSAHAAPIHDGMEDDMPLLEDLDEDELFDDMEDDCSFDDMEDDFPFDEMMQDAVLVNHFVPPVPNPNMRPEGAAPSNPAQPTRDLLAEFDEGMQRVERWGHA